MYSVSVNYWDAIMQLNCVVIRINEGIYKSLKFTTCVNLLDRWDIMIKSVKCFYAKRKYLFSSVCNDPINVSNNVGFRVAQICY